jgi:metallo-beta-lactamase family protein
MGNVTFLGACGTVTGSSTLLELGKSRLLVDCGLYQGDDELEQRNRAAFPFDPATLDAVLLTHAHLDHSGLLPRLVAEGFRGPIYCTKPSRGLAALVLEDAGALQEEEARYATRRRYSRHAKPRPIYTVRDARAAIDRLEPLPFDAVRELGAGIHFRFRRAGHLLGAASIEVSAKGSDGERRSWCFSGDVGRYDVPILHDPEPPLDPPAALLLESTYGDRSHPHAPVEDALAAVIARTFARGGMVVIPAFALGRTQDLLWHLAALADRGLLDPSQVFVDSPMAAKATRLYDQAHGEHDPDLVALEEAARSPLAADRFQFMNSSEQSKSLNYRREPAVIVAASGMANGGRVVHHLIHHLPDPASTVLFVGYQAAGTRGRALLEGADAVGIHGQRVVVKAEIAQMQGLSAHADREELLRWCRALPTTPQRVFLNHGEDPPRKALAAALVELGWPRPELPQRGDQVPW